MQCLGLGTELDVQSGARGYLRAGKGGVLQGLSNLSAIFENGGTTAAAEALAHVALSK